MRVFFIDLVFVLTLLMMSVKDIKTMEVPDCGHIVIVMLGLLCPHSLSFRLYGALIIPFFMLMLYWLWPGCMGFADIKLAVAAGFMLGVEKLYVAMHIAVYSACLFALLRYQKNLRIPFVPFMSLGLIISLGI